MELTSYLTKSTQCEMTSQFNQNVPTDCVCRCKSRQLNTLSWLFFIKRNDKCKEYF